VNITGHGYRKLMRANHNFNYVVETLPVPQPIFEAIQYYGKVSDEEMYGNFNMGAGFAIYISERDINATLDAINVDSKWQFRALRVGYVEKSKQRRVSILPLGISYGAKTLNLR
jgi:phosphoribosylformylglycinamidine cyclo-ligase